jgi:hypothetical protein
MPIARSEPTQSPSVDTDIIPGGKQVSNQPNETDDVVDQFIEYDLGKLTGDAGDRARRKFESLDYKAIPALVRGLNKSAAIQASCPVMVIETKLYQEVYKSRDPNLVAYALNNLGRDVPQSAAHMQRLVRLRENIRIQFLNRDRLRADFAKRNLPSSDSFIDKVQAQRQLTFLDLTHGMNHADKETRLAAIVETQHRSWSGISPEPRMQMAQALLENLNIGDAQTVEESHKALLALTTDNVQQMVPDEKADAATKVRLWQQYWDAFRIKTIDQRAHSMLRLAKNLDDSGNADGAITYYKRIVKDFPRSPVAKTAKERIQELSK